ncbi:MAG: S8 family serine peptidase [Candidatus Poribacteria bacterium]|nr:S8 family serine peptidase [Candidatus Poribacteria bacterium]
MRKYWILFYFIIFLLYLLNSITTEASEQNQSFSHSDSLIGLAHTPGELIVRLHSSASINHLRTFSKKIGAESVSPVFSQTTPAGRHPLLSRTYLVRFPSTLELEQLKQKYVENVLIENVEMNRLNRFCAETTPNDPRYDEQWNLKAMNLPKVWGIERGKTSVVVAVVDSGIIIEHPEFRNQLWQNPGEIPDNGVDDDQNGYVDDINGWDFSDAPTLQGHGDWRERDNKPDDETGHGTHVSGIIAAEANNEVGIAGIAWGCRLMPLRAGFRVGAGAFLQNDDVAAAIVYAADNGADIINLSLGDTVNAFLIQDAVEYAYNRGCILIAAAGNSPEPGAYYPAALNTVLSVASLDKNLQLGNSNFGASIDIAAPGEEILSTDINVNQSSRGYNYRSGTSMAAAHVSGVAALLISANPSCSNTEIQQWLTDTVRELSITNLVGAGLVDAYAALTEQIGLTAHIAIKTSPQTRVSENSTIEIFGSAGGAGFTQYWLEYGISETPELWFRIGIPQTKPKYNTVLHEWDTSALEVGIYTLRLSVKDRNGKTIRDKVVVEIRHTLPQISKHEGSVWLSGNHFDSTIIWQTDVLTTGAVEIFPKSENQPLISNNFQLRGAYSDSVHLQHVVYLSELGLPSGEYLYRLTAQNRTGLIRVDDNDGQLYPITVRDDQIQPFHLLQASSAQFGMHAVVTPKDMNGNGKLELIGVETTTTGQSLPRIYETDDNGKLIIIASLDPSKSVSRLWAIGDTDEDGLVELLCNESDETFLLEQSAPGEFPTVQIWKANGIWGGTIADLDLDGKPEIFSRHDTTNSIWVYESNENNSYANIATLENPTQGKNKIDTRFATGDFDADGQIEILAGDSDGELFIYENVGNNQYRQTWVDTLPDGIPHLFAAGDMDGDTIPEFAVGAKVWTTEFDLPRQHWLFTIFKSDGNDTYHIVWHQRIRQLRDEESGITIADANNDGRNELCIAASPNFYLVQYDGISYRPIWHHPATTTFNPIVADIDNDDTNELLFNTENGLTIFKNSDATVSQSENGKVPNQPDSVSVIPTEPPQMISAVYSPPNQLLLAFNKPMGISAANSSRYRLHRQKTKNNDETELNNTEYYAPQSAIFDKSHKRVVLTFSGAVFNTNNYYKIETFQLSDISGTDIPENGRTLTVEFPIQSHTGMVVYPNPARDNQVTFDRLPADSRIDIYDISGNRIATLVPTEDDIAGNRCRKVWSLDGVSNGVYIYVLEAETGRQVGKLSVIR